MSEGNGLPEDHALALALDLQAEWETKIEQLGEERFIAEMRRFALVYVGSELGALLDQDERELDDLRRMRELVGMLIELGEAIPQEAESG